MPTRFEIGTEERNRAETLRLLVGDHARMDPVMSWHRLATGRGPMRIVLVLQLTGAAIALLGPILGCVVKDGDELLRAAADPIDCWSDLDHSLSHVLTSPVGAAMFGVGISIYYCMTVLVAILLLFHLGIGRDHRPAWSVLLMVFYGTLVTEFVGMVLCSATPTINSEMKTIHDVAFGTWGVSGVLFCVLFACTCFAIEREDKPVFARDVRIVIYGRAMLLLFMGVYTLVLGMGDYDTGALFRLSEYLLLFATAAINIALTACFAFPIPAH